MIVVIARVRARPDRVDELVELLEEVQEASRADDGCLHPGYLAGIVDRESQVAVEEWRDRAALDAHLREPHVARLVTALPGFVAAPPEVTIHEVEASEPMVLPGP